MNIDISSLLRHLAQACRLGAVGNYPFYPVRFAVPVGEYLGRRSARRATEGATAKTLGTRPSSAVSQNRARAESAPSDSTTR